MFELETLAPEEGCTLAGGRERKAHRTLSSSRAHLVTLSGRVANIIIMFLFFNFARLTTVHYWTDKVGNLYNELSEQELSRSKKLWRTWHMK